MPSQPNPDVLLPWDTHGNIRHNVRALCDLEGLTFAQKNELCATVACESNFDLNAKNENMGKRPTSLD